MYYLPVVIMPKLQGGSGMMTSRLDSSRMKSPRAPRSTFETNQFDRHPGHDAEGMISIPGEECDAHSVISTRSSFDGICMIDGCDAQGEEFIALLEDDSNANQDRVDSPYMRQRSKVKEPSGSDEIIPAIVCSKHFDELILAYYDLKKL
jgi:hypothetical protein